MSEARPGVRLALREPNLRRFVASRFFSGAAMTLLRAAFAWQVFELTGSAFQLAWLGLAQFVPTLLLSLVGGAVADSYDRRKVAMAAQGATLVGSLLLWRAASAGETGLGLFYAVVVASSVAAAFDGPARAALLPTLVPRTLFPSAVTVHATVQQLGWLAGPLTLGFVLDAAGVAAAYALNVGLVLASLLSLAWVRPPPTPGRVRDLSWRAIREGIAFVRSRDAVLGAMALDMFAVIFAGATALLPIYVEQILAVGPRGYGLLASALEIGTFSMALVLLLLPPIRRPGRALLAAVGVFGVATIVFGLSRSFALSFGAFVVAGMADQVSMVARATLIQLATPDDLRGRVSAVNLVFIGASNQLGAVESGVVAGLTSATFSVVSGGLACLGVLAWVALRMPGLRRYRVDLEESMR